MMHDFALTAGHLIFMDLPVVFDMDLAMSGTMPFVWSDTYGARLGILPRGAGIEKLRWVEIEPCYVYHVANAFEAADGTITVDVAWYKEQWRGGAADAKSSEGASLRRWRIVPGALKAEEMQLDDRRIEFPRIDERSTGQPHNIVYALANDRDFEGGAFGALLQYDLKSGHTLSHDFGIAEVPSEFVMVPGSPSGGQDEGWLLGFVYDRSRNASDLIILDAQSISAKPVARVRLPKRVPQGFHGSWIAGPAA